MHLHVELVISHSPRMRNDEFNVQMHAGLHESSHIELVISHSRRMRNDKFNVLRGMQVSMHLNVEAMAVCGMWRVAFCVWRLVCGVLCVV